MSSAAPLIRGLAGKCPNCGRARVRDGLWEIKDECPSCRYSFVREDGYWVGAMTVMMALMILGFIGTIVTAVILTWPEVPVLQTTVAMVVVTALIGGLTYGWAKTIWVGLDLSFNPASAVEEAEMETRRAADERPTSERD